MLTRRVFGTGTLVVCVMLLALPAAAQTPPAPTNDDCMACHDDNGLGKSVHAAQTCVGCHADLKANTEWPHAEKLQTVSCGTCHNEQGGQYADSVHGRARMKSGLNVAPGCSTCHGKHDIQRTAGPESTVHRTRVAATCATCHDGILPQYANSIHAKAHGFGNASAAVCTDCHTAHRIQRSETDTWRLSVIEECGTCHLDRIATYRDTFHGQVTALGFTRVAMCSDCHDNHAILPASSPASTVSPQNLVTTCRKCHSEANEKFVQYDPHANKHDRYRSPVVYWAYIFMQLLLAGVFISFGAHTLLWFPRSFRARRERRAAEQNGRNGPS